ncbi:hypothetical protein OAI54_04195, partial [Pseudomonadales bacterium]|nr:hypothetical protein [Pseudomonadales bacterium]
VAASTPFDNLGAFTRIALEPSIFYNLDVSRAEIGAEATDILATVIDDASVKLIESAEPGLPEPDTDTERREIDAEADNEGADNEGADNEGADDEATSDEVTDDEVTGVVAGADIDDAQRINGLRIKPHG